MKKKIIGRLKEQEILGQVLNSERAEFLAIYGRRRVGKTYLIKNFFESESGFFFYASGMQEGSILEQLEEFSKQIGRTFYNGATIKPTRRWKDAFEDLNYAISNLPGRKKVVIFLDELPWMATPKSGLLKILDYYWNRYWSHNSRVKLVVCGSSASWIIEKIINNKGGLHNRVTRTMNLGPFSLSETFDFLKSLKLKLTQKQVLEIYMVFGGVPHYLSLIRPGISANQAIEELCFQKNGALVGEFDRLFASLFSEPESYVALIEKLAEYPQGLGQAELAKKVECSTGGGITKKLQALSNAGFVLEFTSYGHKDKGLYYKVIDEFSLFYLRWIRPNLSTIAKQNESPGYWLSKAQSPSFKSWAGYAFESICFKHLGLIRKALNIEAGANIGSWKYAPRKNSEENGAQIDLLFDRNDGVVTVCEIKHNETPFIIDKDYFNKLNNKIQVYQCQTKTTKQIFVAMITVNGLKPTIYSEEIVHGLVILKDFFS